MQFRLSTFLLAVVVFGTSLALAGAWGIPCAAYMLVLIGLSRVCLRGGGGMAGACLVLFAGIGLPILLSPMYSHAGPAARRAQCANNLKQIALGLRQYREKFGCLPPAHVPDENGKPMHSWRVLVLPFMERHDLYRAYRFDEPWDGPNNSRLAAPRPRFYACYGDRTPSALGGTATNYFAVVGAGTPWGSEQPPRAAKPIEDDRRVLVVEVENSGINWMEPKDLTLDQAIARITAKSGTRISSGHDTRLANVVLVDSLLAELPTDLSPDLLRTVLTQDFNRLYEHIPRERIQQMRYQRWDQSPYLGLRLLACMASVLILFVHGVVYDIREKRQKDTEGSRL